MRNPTLLHYIYYHCTKSKNPRCTQKSVESKELEKQIATYLSRIEISPHFRDWAIKYLREIYGQEVVDRNTDIESQRKIYQDCLKRLDNLVKLKTSPQNADGSLLSDEEYGKQRLQLLKEKTRLEELFQDTGHRVEHWIDLAEKTFAFACRASEWFAKGDLKVKKEILSAIGSNLTLRDKKLSIEAKHPFVILEKSLSRNHRGQATLEPKKFLANKGKKERVSALRPSGLGGRDVVRTYRDGQQLGWHVTPKEILLHMSKCEKECSRLDSQLDNLFGMISAYREQAA